MIETWVRAPCSCFKTGMARFEVGSKRLLPTMRCELQGSLVLNDDIGGHAFAICYEQVAFSAQF